MNTYLPPPIAGGQKTAGPRLPARMKVRPLSLTRVIGLRGLAFNASLTDEHGALRLAYRSGWRRASVRICTLTDKDFRPRDDHQLIAPVAEDPRLFHHAGELFVSYASARWSGRKIRRVIMRVARVENGAITTPTFVRLQPKEKNWGFFEYEEQLYAVYAVEPHTVLRFADGLRGEPLEQTPWTRLKSDTLRGGAPPIRHGSEYYCFFHTVDIRPSRGGRQTYCMGLYTFQAKPPFRPSRYLPHALLSPNTYDPFPTTRKHVIFPAGAVYRDQRWLVSYGYQDAETWIAQFDEADIEQRLIPVCN